MCPKDIWRLVLRGGSRIKQENQDSINR